MSPKRPETEQNRAVWDRRVAIHMASAFYDVPGFKAGRNSLNPIELDLLGEVKGLSVLHLQCHFGQDSISLSRMGAEVTGVDFSPKAIEAGRALAEALGTTTRFVCCDVYDLPQHLNGQFDIVFTSYGTIGWLPDLEPWAKIVAHFLKPGGRFVMADFHPVLWMFEDSFQTLHYSYFNTGPIVEESQGTYAEPSAALQTTATGWNHAFSELLGCLLRNDLQLQDFREFDHSPYNCFPGMVQEMAGQWIFPQHGRKLPLVYAFCMQKNTQD